MNLWYARVLPDCTTIVSSSAERRIRTRSRSYWRRWSRWGFCIGLARMMMVSPLQAELHVQIHQSGFYKTEYKDNRGEKSGSAENRQGTSRTISCLQTSILKYTGIVIVCQVNYSIVLLINVAFPLKVVSTCRQSLIDIPMSPDPRRKQAGETTGCRPMAFPTMRGPTTSPLST